MASVVNHSISIIFQSLCKPASCRIKSEMRISPLSFWANSGQYWLILSSYLNNYLSNIIANIMLIMALLLLINNTGAIFLILLLYKLSTILSPTQTHNYELESWPYTCNYSKCSMTGVYCWSYVPEMYFDLQSIIIYDLY